MGYLIERGIVKYIGSIIEQLAIKVTSPAQSVRTLSGGNQQKVSIGKWMGESCDVWIFDEPTQGIDVDTKTEIYTIMSQLAQQGSAIWFISSDLRELTSICDRIYVMYDFAIAAEFTAPYEREDILTKMMGGIRMKERAMNSRFQQLLTKYGTILALVIVTLMFSLFVPGFVNSRNLLNILRQVALLAVIAEGFTMCLIVDELDLSFANVASLASVIAGALILGGMHPFLAIVIVLAVGAGIGLLNGLLVTKVGIPSLITTLAMGIISVGFIYMFTDGLSLYGAMPAGFLFLGRGSIAGIPFLVIIMFAVVLLAHVLVNKFKVGKYMQATGANVRAARLAGINTDFYKILGLVLSSAGAALTGILLTSRLGTANPEGATGFMMDSFASALMGMTVLSIGRAKPLGTLVGVLMIGVISNGMTLAGAPYYMQDITKGVIILLSVTITSLQSKRQADA